MEKDKDGPDMWDNEPDRETEIFLKAHSNQQIVLLLKLIPQTRGEDPVHGQFPQMLNMS